MVPFSTGLGPDGRSSMRPRQIATVALVLALTVAAFFGTRLFGERDARLNSEYRAEVAAAQIRGRVEQGSFLAESLAQFMLSVAGSRDAGEEFESNASRWLNPAGFPAAAWVEQVPASQRAAYERRTSHPIVTVDRQLSGRARRPAALVSAGNSRLRRLSHGPAWNRSQRRNRLGCGGDPRQRALCRERNPPGNPSRWRDGAPSRPVGSEPQRGRRHSGVRRVVRVGTLVAGSGYIHRAGAAHRRRHLRWRSRAARRPCAARSWRRDSDSTSPCRWSRSPAPRRSCLGSSSPSASSSPASLARSGSTRRGAPGRKTSSTASSIFLPT